MSGIDRQGAAQGLSEVLSGLGMDRRGTAARHHRQRIVAEEYRARRLHVAPRLPARDAIDLLLPELEQGMFDAGWRIRQSSITLVGELLFKVSGITTKPEIGDDEDVAPNCVCFESVRSI
ncbi:hypothetical protein HD554DRAFT_2167598 [Boletus coccyginus]|nr:hypothetical protein HD554DRAFT_2167598 [Boletus coccyginus]